MYYSYRHFVKQVAAILTTGGRIAAAIYQIKYRLALDVYYTLYCNGPEIFFPLSKLPLLWVIRARSNSGFLILPV